MMVGVGAVFRRFDEGGDMGRGAGERLPDVAGCGIGVGDVAGWLKLAPNIGMAS